MSTSWARGIGVTPRQTSLPVWRLAPIAALVVLLAVRALSLPAYLAVVREDGPMEWLTFVVYAGALAVALVDAVRLGRRGDRLLAVAFVALAGGFLFVGGEEISWGQRLFGFDGPEALVEANLQSEANLHNLLPARALHGAYIVVGLYGAGVGRWAASKVPALRGRTWLVAPEPALAVCFGAVAALYVYYDYLSPIIVLLLGDDFGWQRFSLGRLQEAAELGLAAGFLGFVLQVRQRLGRGAEGAVGHAERLDPGPVPVPD